MTQQNIAHFKKKNNPQIKPIFTTSSKQTLIMKQCTMFSKHRQLLIPTKVLEILYGILINPDENSIQITLYILLQ